MAWTAPRTWVANEVVSAAIMNTHVRDNLLETAVAKVTAAGDIVYASGANALSRLAKGTAGQVLRMNSGATAPEWGAAGKSVINIGTLTSFAPAETFYMRWGDSGRSASDAVGSMTRLDLPFACNIRNLRVNLSNSLSTASTTITVRKNGVGTALAVVLSAGTTTGQDLTDTIAFAAGDDLSVEIAVASGGTGSISAIVASMECEPT